MGQRTVSVVLFGLAAGLQSLPLRQITIVLALAIQLRVSCQGACTPRRIYDVQPDAYEPRSQYAADYYWRYAAVAI